MGTRDIKAQQEKLRVKSDLLKARIAKEDAATKVKDLAARLKRMGGR